MLLEVFGVDDKGMTGESVCLWVPVGNATGATASNMTGWAS